MGKKSLTEKKIKEKWRIPLLSLEVRKPYVGYKVKPRNHKRKY